MRSMRPFRLISTAFAGLLVAGPLFAEEPVAKPDRAATRPEPASTASPSATACRTDAQPAIPNAPAERAEQKAAFALALLTAVAGQDKKNLAVSPFGVAAVLTALDLGADPAMKKAIARTLGLRPGQPGLDALRKDARVISVIGGHSGSPMKTADGLFVDHALTLAPDIEDRVQAESGIAIEKLDFGSAEAIEHVDRWAAERTDGRIKSILEPGSTPSLVAVNAFVFKDCWRVPFDPAATSPQPFHLLDGSSADRATMSIEDQTFPYAASGRFIALELPYADERFAISLVTTRDSPAGAAAFASAGRLLLGDGLRPTRVRVALPKFTGTGEHDLLATLSKLGLASGLASKTQLAGFAGGLSLSAVRQKTFIAVDETGTEAAAATAAVTSRGLEPEAEGVSVKFDRPFIYALRHRATGTIVMTGYVADPQIATD
jgi:serpin B